MYHTFILPVTFTPVLRYQAGRHVVRDITHGQLFVEQLTPGTIGDL